MGLRLSKLATAVEMESGAALVWCVRESGNLLLVTCSRKPSLAECHSWLSFGFGIDWWCRVHFAWPSKALNLKFRDQSLCYLLLYLPVGRRPSHRGPPDDAVWGTSRRILAACTWRLALVGSARWSPSSFLQPFVSPATLRPASSTSVTTSPSLSPVLAAPTSLTTPLYFWFELVSSSLKSPCFL